MLHSVIQNCCWITLQVSHHQKWRVKPIFRGAWKSLMAWRDWTWRPVFNDRSTPLSLYERCVSSKNNSGHGPGKITGKKIRKYWCSWEVLQRALWFRAIFMLRANHRAIHVSYVFLLHCDALRPTQLTSISEQSLCSPDQENTSAALLRELLL